MIAPESKADVLAGRQKPIPFSLSQSISSASLSKPLHTYGLCLASTPFRHQETVILEEPHPSSALH